MSNVKRNNITIYSINDLSRNELDLIRWGLSSIKSLASSADQTTIEDLVNKILRERE